LRAGPKRAREQLALFSLEFSLPARAHHLLEAFVHFLLQRLEMCGVARIFRLERIEHRLALARRVYATVDADLLDQLLETEAGGNDADRTDDRILVRVNLVARKQQHVAAGGGDVFAEGHDLDALLRRERADTIVDQRRLNGGPARRVDDHRGG